MTFNFFKKKISMEEMVKSFYFATVLNTVKDDLKDQDGNIILTKKEWILMLTQHLYVLFEKHNLGKAKLYLLTTHVVNNAKIKNDSDLTCEMLISLDAIEKIRKFLQELPAPEESYKFFKAKFLFDKDLNPIQKTLAMARYVAYCKVIDSVFESSVKNFTSQIISNHKKYMNELPKKRKYTLIILLSIFIILLFFTLFFLSSITNQNRATADSPQKIANNQQIPEISAEQLNVDDIAEFTDEELKYLDGLDREPNIQFIRTAINAFLATGEGDGSEITMENDNNCGLNNFREYISGKFVAFQVGTAPNNIGLSIDIIFPDKPDKIFEVTEYQSGNNNNRYLMAFCAKPYSDNAVQVITKAFGRLFKNDKIAL